MLSFNKCCNLCEFGYQTFQLLFNGLQVAQIPHIVHHIIVSLAERSRVRASQVQQFGRVGSSYVYHPAPSFWHLHQPIKCESQALNLVCRIVAYDIG